MKLLILMVALCVCLCACAPAVTPETTTTVPQPSQTEAPITTTDDSTVEETGDPGLLKPEYETTDPLLFFTFPPEYGELVLPELELDDDDCITSYIKPIPVTTEPAAEGSEPAGEGSEPPPQTTQINSSLWDDEPGVVLPEIELED